MSAFLIISNKIQPFDGRIMRSPAIYDLMMEHECWEFTDSAPHLPLMKEGDELFFYLGGPGGQYLAGEAKVAGKPEPITKDSPKTFDRNAVPFYTLRMPLRDIVRYGPGKAGLATLEKISFVRESPVERKYIGLLLRVGVRKLTAEDAAVIRKDAGVETGRRRSASSPG